MRAAATPLLLPGAVGAVLVYCAFASGGTQLPARGYVTVLVAALALAAAAGCLYGSLRFRPARAALVGLALLGLFAAWSGASIGWSVQPDGSWKAFNTALTYALAVGIGVVIGSSSSRGAERTVQVLALATVPVALYALGGKTLPGVRVDGLFSLDQAGGYNRLKAPLHYWNALALFGVCGLLPMLRLAVDPARRSWRRIAALLGVYLLVLVVTLTYSRGGFVALAVGLVVLVALGTERLRTIAAFAVALAAAAVPLAVALSSRDLTTDALPLAQREDDALVVLVLVLVMAALLAVVGRLAQRLSFDLGRLARPAAVAATVLVAAGLVAFVASGRLADGVDSFTDTSAVAGVTDPNRLLSGNSGNRWTWWKEAAGAWSDKPVAGWGAGSFPVTHRLYRQDQLTVQQPHSVPLQWLAEVGLIGFALAAAGLLVLLGAAVARVRSTRERGHAAALLAVAAAWMVHSLYDWDWDIPAVTLPMALALGVLGARPPERGPRPPVQWRAPALAFAVVAFALVATSALLPAIAKTRTTAVLAAAGARVGDERLAELAADAEVAARLNPLAVEPLFAVATIARRRGREQDERSALLRALERQPDSVFVWVKLATFEFVRGNPRGVRLAAVRALALDPRNPGLIGVARRAAADVAPPEDSATATGAPLPTDVEVPAP